MFDYLFWKFVYASLQKFDYVGIAFVVDHKGSSPGKSGFRLAVDKDSRTLGSIGGALMEHKLIKKIEIMLENGYNSSPITFNIFKQVHNRKAKETEQSGLICSGEQTIIYGILRNSELSIIQRIIDNFFDKMNHILEITSESFSFNDSEQEAQYNENMIEFSSEPNKWKFRMKTSLHYHIYIFGAGHVGKAIAQVFENLNFIVHLLDFRKEMFKDYRSKKWVITEIISNYDSIKADIYENKYSFVTIVNTNIIHDIESLIIVLRKNVKYIGLMGTTAKRLEIFKKLKEKNFSENELEKIKSPFGIEIGSQSGEEIAISVASEVIKIKNS